MKNQLNSLLTFVCVMIGIFASGTVVAAEPPHPYHVSLAEVNWNPKSQKFEVALCLWPADLEKALARQTGRPVDLAKEPNVDRLLESYVSQRFIIRSAVRDAEHAKDQQPGPESLGSLPPHDAGNKVAANSTTVAESPALAESAARPTSIGTIAVTVSSDTQAPAKIKWYGHEADAKKAWLYFEIAGDGEVDWSIENRVFFELNDDQLNHVQWSGTGKTETLVCNADNPEISLPKK